MLPISVVIPTYNQKTEFLISAIQSVFSQTLLPKELVIINDGGQNGFFDELIEEFSIDKPLSFNREYFLDDKSKTTVSNYFLKEFKVVFVDSTKNRGTAGALNLGLRYSSYDYISWLSSDDFFYPHFLEVHSSILESSKCLVSYSGWGEVTYNPNMELIGFGDYKPPFFQNNGNIPRLIKQEEFKQSLLSCLNAGSCVYNGCAFVLSRDIFDKVGQFNEEFILTQDFEMWLRVGQEFDVIMTPHILMCRRNHNNRTQDMYHEKEVLLMKNNEFKKMRDKFLYEKR